jgi:beta-glucosidase
MVTTEGPVHFPPDFAWGVATSSYQIEGAVSEGGRGRSIWDGFSHTPGATVGGATGDVACDHYHRYREDVALMDELGTDAYRFSFAWPRLQPDGRGELNSEGVAFYDRLIDELLERGIRPWVTLYHWDLPQVLEDAGGWPVRETAYRFVDFATAVHGLFADRVADWTTLNEPWCSAFLGYASGHHAPGRQEPVAAIKAAHHLLLGHGLAVEAMRAAASGLRYGLTLNLYPISAATSEVDDIDAARRVDGVVNRIFLDPVLRGGYPQDVLDDLADFTDGSFISGGDEQQIAQPLDILGVNYYTTQVVRAVREGDVAETNTAWVGCSDVVNVGTGLPTTEMGWEIDAGGLYEVLTRVNRDYDPPPIYITENGAAFGDVVSEDGGVHDPERIDYLDSHLRAAHRAMSDGVGLSGFFVWSLLDNFEWAWGYSRRFGLTYVDFASQRRIVKDSGHRYSQVIAGNALISV